MSDDDDLVEKLRRAGKLEEAEARIEATLKHHGLVPFATETTMDAERALEADLLVVMRLGEMVAAPEPGAVTIRCPECDEVCSLARNGQRTLAKNPQIAVACLTCVQRLFVTKPGS